MSSHAMSSIAARVGLVLLLVAAPLASVRAQTPEDPWERLNRGTFAFNQVVDGLVLRPAALGYRFVVPQFGRNRVNDVFRNLSEPVSFLNALLQGEPDVAGNALGRFMINSTLGLGGLFDVAANLEPPYARRVQQEEFGQTLAVWGWKESNYFVIPLLGPSTVRDTGGLVVDFATVPWGLVAPAAVTWTATGVRIVSARANVLDLLDDLERSSLDYYASLRSLFLQRRAFDISNGAVGSRDDIFDEFD